MCVDDLVCRAVPVDVVREVEVPVQQKRQQIQQRQVSSSFSYADDDDDRWFDCILLQPIASPSNCPRDDDDPATLFVITVGIPHMREISCFSRSVLLRSCIPGP